MNFNITLIANTLWFIEKFKYDLIKKLLINNNVKCFYLREGPVHNKEKIDFLISKGVTFEKLNIRNSFKIFVKQFFKIKDNFNNKSRILVFTIGPIIISQLLFFKQKKTIVYVLEGLGRVFSSRKIFYRIIKRFIIQIYKYIFKDCKKVVTLNYSDATYLVDMKISTLDKIFTIPGTGFKCDESNFQNFLKSYEPKFIDYIARLVEDKGFYSFLYTKLYINKHMPFLLRNNKFRIITPQSDIDNLSEKEIKYLQEIGISLCPYIADPMKYYRESKVIIMPTTYGEGLSRLLLESLYFGIPILVSRNNGTEELLPVDYKYFIKSFNPSSIAKQLMMLIDDKDYFADNIPKQKELIDEHYSFKASIKDLEKLLYE